MRRSFTLIEVIISLGIFALFAVALLSAVTTVQQALIDTRESSDRGEAKRYVLRRALAATSYDDLSANTSAPLPEGGNVSWTTALEETDIPDLHRLTLSIDWGNDETEEVSIWVYRPEWSDPSSRSNLLQTLRTEFPQSRLSTF
ncbi:MAG: type II secretion system GspH family protein [Puniceicoccales bacterium]|nr:type II secretion system GspH family protein [Puniceicoccales bacterium]